MTTQWKSLAAGGNGQLSRRQRPDRAENYLLPEGRMLPGAPFSLSGDTLRRLTVVFVAQSWTGSHSSARTGNGPAVQGTRVAHRPPGATEVSATTSARW